MNILVDTLRYYDIDDYILNHVVDALCNIPMRVEEYANKMLNFISNHKYEKSHKLHK